MPLARVSAISGAAVSSNMGNKTTQTLSIVLTLFNVRLGRWVRNPRLFQRSSIKRPPSLYLYFKELFAQASRDDEVVYLSDGGHFENLGVYELFRRRCRFIVAVSADVEDPKSEDRMGNLGNALRMGRVDFAVDVIFNDIQRIVRDPKTGKVECSFVVGELSYGGPKQDNGVFVLIKSGLPKDGLSADLLEYWQGHPSFPYDSTSDQQFDQPQIRVVPAVRLSRRAGGWHTVSTCKRARRIP